MVNIAADEGGNGNDGSNGKEKAGGSTAEGEPMGEGKEDTGERAKKKGKTEER